MSDKISNFSTHPHAPPLKHILFLMLAPYFLLPLTLFVLELIPSLLTCAFASLPFLVLPLSLFFIRCHQLYLSKYFLCIGFSCAVASFNITVLPAALYFLVLPPSWLFLRCRQCYFPIAATAYLGAATAYLVGGGVIE